jgi:hypothetical protein
MTGAPEHHDATSPKERADREPIRYPTNHVLGVLDTQQAVNAVTAALMSSGFMESEIQVGTGAERGDELQSTTGRSGLAHVLMRFADWIGVTNEEMEAKDRYEQAMRDNRFVLSVATPTEERKLHAARILREHGAHTVAFFSKHMIEHIVAPNDG